MQLVRYFQRIFTTSCKTARKPLIKRVIEGGLKNSLPSDGKKDNGSVFTML
jgi:hypothetical protein